MTAEGTAGRGPGPKVPQRQVPECQVAHPRSPKPGSDGIWGTELLPFPRAGPEPREVQGLDLVPWPQAEPTRADRSLFSPAATQGGFSPTAGSRGSGQSLRVGLAFCLFGFFKFRTEHPVGCQTARETGGLGRTGLKEASPGNPKLRLTQRARRKHSLTKRPSLSLPLTAKSDISNSRKPGLSIGLTLGTCLISSVSPHSPSLTVGQPPGTLWTS